MALLDDVKVALRISAVNLSFDTEINDLIDAAKRDLLISGIVVTDETDPLIKRAIVTYCKAHFGYDNPGSRAVREGVQCDKAAPDVVQRIWGDG